MWAPRASTAKGGRAQVRATASGWPVLAVPGEHRAPIVPIQLGQHPALMHPEAHIGTAGAAGLITCALDPEEAGERWTVGLLRWTSVERSLEGVMRVASKLRRAANIPTARTRCPGRLLS